MNSTDVPNCRLCGANPDAQFVRAEHVFGSREGHKFYQCRACDLVYLWPIPSEKQEGEFYANEFEKYMESRAKNDRDWSGPEKHKKTNQDNVVRRMGFLAGHWEKGDSILEVGCSSGFMMDAFRDAGMKPVGIELSNGFNEYLKKNNHEFYDSIAALREGRPGHKFDLIVHFFVLEHIRDTAQFLNEQLELLADDGVLIAEVPCVNDPLTSLYTIPAFEKFYWSIAHHYYFSPKAIAHALKDVDAVFELVPEQRYDLSNHLIWLQKGQPGGQGFYKDVFSQETLNGYKNDLIRNWKCDTFFLYLRKKAGGTKQ